MYPDETAAVLVPTVWKQLPFLLAVALNPLHRCNNCATKITFFVHSSLLYRNHVKYFIHCRYELSSF